MVLALFIFLVVIVSDAYAVPNFFDQRYRGWIWFEEKEQVKRQEEEQKSNAFEAEEITAEDAKREVEFMTKELEDLKNIYIARPSFKTQKAYRDKLTVNLNRWQMMSQLWDEQNFLVPEYKDLVQSPDNVFAVKLNRKIDEDANKEIIQQFAANYQLVFFFRRSCPRSTEFEPVLKRFSDMHNIKVEAVSVDGSESSYFSAELGGAKFDRELITKLGIEATPTVIAVRNDGKRAFELIRGFVTISELEGNVVMAWRLAEERGIKVGREL